MLLSGHAIRRTLVEVMGTGALAGAMLFGGAPLAFAEPMPAPPPPPAPPGCTAGDLAQVSGTVGTAMAGYFFTHPDVNNFFTSLRGLPSEEVRANVQNYLNANPQVESEIHGIRQPLTDLRTRMPLNRCRRRRWAHPDRLLPRPQAQTRRTLSLVVERLR